MSMKVGLSSAVRAVTKSWKQAKRQADRQDRVSIQSLQRMRCKPQRVTVRSAAFRVMKAAYLKASAGGKYYANARQIMYAARPAILAATGDTSLNDVYFTQTLLKDYIEEYRPGWKVAWDARGHLLEPHTGRTVSLGGVAVKQYVDAWTSSSDPFEVTIPELPERIDTSGPLHRFSSALFIEKEGFAEILEDAGIGKRYDMAILSTKGLPVDAACDLLSAMCRQHVRIFVLHDFDLAGFKIVRTLRNGTRLSRGSTVIDLGLRMEDIAGLPAEPVNYDQSKDPSLYLRQCGATAEETAFLVHPSRSYSGWSGERVEINAMTSDQLLEWLERKLGEHGTPKVIPDDKTLANAYRRARKTIELRDIIETEGDRIDEELKSAIIPQDLSKQLADKLRETPELSWDQALAALVAKAAPHEQ